jgi:hypothetical protein
MQNNDFRSTTNLRALGRSRSDNTFATAINLGRITPNATRVSFRASGTVGRSDTVDFYKFTASPGVNLPSGRNNFRLRNGSAILSVYGEASGIRKFGARFRLQRGSTFRSSSLINPVQSPFTFYLRVERRIGETQYNLKFNFFR